ncbi:hypothetical protein Tco_1100736 [Tanacetum coccineum]
MAQPQQQRDVPQDQLCPPNKRFNLMDANKKFDLFWHTLKEDGSKYKVKFLLGTKALIMNVADFKRIFQLPQAIDNNHVGFVNPLNFVFRVDVPTTQSQPIVSTQGTHTTTSAPRTPNPVTTEGESSAPCKSTVIRLRVPRRQDPETPIPIAAEDKELDHLLEGTENADVDEFMSDIFNNQEDPDTRIDPRSYKESPEVENDVDLVIVNANEEEEESAGDEFELRRRVKGKGIEETRGTPPSTPIRSPRTHKAPLSTNKETLQELTIITEDAPSFVDKEKLKELTVTDPTPSSSIPLSSSSPKPKTGRFR